MGKNTARNFAFHVLSAGALMIVAIFGVPGLCAQQANYLLAPNDLVSEIGRAHV